jgi:DNA repair exonuclease SbcCD ATPase subunit
MLCGERRLHCTAVGLNAISDEQYQQLDRMEAISQFAAGKNMYRVTRRKEYGAHAASTRVRQIQRGQFWTDQPVDTAEKTELNRRVEEMKAQVNEVQAQFSALRKEQIPALEAQYQEINEKEQELRKQKGELQAAWNKWNALPDKIGKEFPKLRLRGIGSQ